MESKFVWTKLIQQPSGEKMSVEGEATVRFQFSSESSQSKFSSGVVHSQNQKMNRRLESVQEANEQEGCASQREERAYQDVKNAYNWAEEELGKPKIYRHLHRTTSLSSGILLKFRLSAGPVVPWTPVPPRLGRSLWVLF